MAATNRLNIRSRAPAGVVGLLLATCLWLAATVASTTRPLKVSSSEGDGAQHTVESPPVGYIIQTVVVGTAAEQDGGAAGRSRLMNVDMLGGIKNSGPSPGDGH
ncbi:unnamed protein product [Miscanthus lutarioriparius]|uniref:Uncharacterized protein n=1 Tax=Miscanthus lutarioriparius TaxID=422564 RepID=A0A811S5A9_9POAL|nr:unnamed protein product [Miscanthus lutarioriparius]